MVARPAVNARPAVDEGARAGSRPPLRCLHVFATFVAAGAQMRSLALWQALGPRFEHVVVALDGRCDAAARASSDLRIELLPAPPRAGSLRTAWRLRQLIASARADALFTYGFAALDALLAARSLGLRGVVHHEDGFTAGEAFALKRRRVAYRRLMLPGCRKVVVVSAGLAELATRRFGVAPSRVARIDNGVDLARHVPADRTGPLRQAIGLEPGDLLVGALGELRRVKRFDRLLRAVACSSAPWRVVLIGAGPEEAALRQLADGPGLRGRVHFAGEQRDPRPWLAALDLFALTSDSEQMPLSLLEAMATRLPVLATAVGEVPRMLPGEQRDFLVDPRAGDADVQLGDRLTRLAADGPLRERLGAANRRTVAEQFTFAAMLEGHRAIYDELAAASGRVASIEGCT